MGKKSIFIYMLFPNDFFCYLEEIFPLVFLFSGVLSALIIIYAFNVLCLNDIKAYYVLIAVITVTAVLTYKRG